MDVVLWSGVQGALRANDRLVAWRNPLQFVGEGWRRLRARQNPSTRLHGIQQASLPRSAKLPKLGLGLPALLARVHKARAHGKS